MTALEAHRALIRELAEKYTVTFILKYEGPLPSANRKPKNSRSPLNKNPLKQAIRRQLHPQLKSICERDKELSILVAQLQGYDEELRRYRTNTPNWEAEGRKFRRGPFQFIPLVLDAAYGTCEVHIQFLRHELPGGLIGNGGDIDNRLKTFFDALRIPNLNQLPVDDSPREGETPFYCLMQDDDLITAFSVESQALHAPTDPNKDDDVELLVRVTVHFREKAYFNAKINL